MLNVLIGAVLASFNTIHKVLGGHGFQGDNNNLVATLLGSTFLIYLFVILISASILKSEGAKIAPLFHKLQIRQVNCLKVNFRKILIKKLIEFIENIILLN